ncbi:MAG: hypothetical protein Q9172_005185 [Xanthocarpia lactea]
MSNSNVDQGAGVVTDTDDHVSDELDLSNGIEDLSLISSTTSSNPPRPSRTVFRFMDLPPEIRNAIYEYCLVVPCEIVPYPTDAEKQDEAMAPKYEKPAVNLTEVSKTVRDEARVYLYGKNLWRLSLQPDPESLQLEAEDMYLYNKDGSIQSLHPDREDVYIYNKIVSRLSRRIKGRVSPALWCGNHQFIRHIRTTFDYRDVTPADKRTIAEIITEIALTQMAIACPIRHDLVAKCQGLVFKAICKAKLEMIRFIMAHGSLTTLRFDFHGLLNPSTLQREPMLELFGKIDALWYVTNGVLGRPRDKPIPPAQQIATERFFKDPRRLKCDPCDGVVIGWTGLHKDELVQPRKMGKAGAGATTNVKASTNEIQSDRQAGVDLST